MTFFPKDKKIQSILDRLSVEKGTYTDFNTAKQLSRYTYIRNIRKKELMYIGMDRAKGVSVIHVIRLFKKKKNGYDF